jgi:hypothetical protein
MMKSPGGEEAGFRVGFRGEQSPPGNCPALRLAEDSYAEEYQDLEVFGLKAMQNGKVTAKVKLPKNLPQAGRRSN